VSASVLTTLLIEWYEAGELDGEVLDIIEENNNINKNKYQINTNKSRESPQTAPIYTKSL
jgi:hypothetical protein